MEAIQTTAPSAHSMKITVIGIVAFLVLVVAFFAWFGGPPVLQDDPSMSAPRIVRAWFYCSVLFLAGAGTACFGDKEYGMFPPTSLRWLFIVFGVVIMAVSATWMHSLTKAWAARSGVFLSPPSVRIASRNLKPSGV